MKLTVLNDDRAGDGRCMAEHGLSILLETSGARVLLDFGKSQRFLQNAEVLGISLDGLDAVVLSHGHFDHANGIAFVEGEKIYCHPDCFVPRYSKISGAYDGIGPTEKEIREKNELTLTKEPVEIAPDIFYLGEIPRVNDFEAGKFPTVLKDGSADHLFDDSGIAINAKEGVVVVTGCAHSGICNTIEYAKRVTGNTKILAVVGGFHLREVNDDLEKVIDYLKEQKADHLLMGHCTCDDACRIVSEQLAGYSRVQILGAGKIFEI